MIDVEKQPDVPYERLGLDPIRNLLERLGDPQAGLAVIHIAGSKGKGSTALFVEAICRAAGDSVGTFTSPHLERWTERFRLDGCEVEGDRLAAVVSRLRPHVDALRAADTATAPTFFDATTAAALLLFAEAGVDRVVLEVGLGGRLDSTNVVSPAVTCVTNIELEHTDKLGCTLAEIAAEKAGILKPGVPAVAGNLRTEARAVLSDRAREVGTSIDWLGNAFSAEVHAGVGEGTALTLRDGDLEIELTLPVLGAHQAENAALALACARRAGVAYGADLAGAARRGLESARLPGRIEVIGRSPLVIVDGAHTAVSARALALVLAAQSARRRHLVLSISAGKDTGAILQALLPEVDAVTVSCVDPLRSIPAHALAAEVRAAAPGLEVSVETDPRRALISARADVADDDLLCATGSVFMAGFARAQLGPARSSRNSRVGD